MKAEPVRFAQNASDEDILTVVRKWSDTLAAEDYEGALAMVHAPGWTADLLKKRLRDMATPSPATRYTR
jgi:hypothetical protein